MLSFSSCIYLLICFLQERFVKFYQIKIYVKKNRLLTAVSLVKKRRTFSLYLKQYTLLIISPYQNYQNKEKIVKKKRLMIFFRFRFFFCMGQCIPMYQITVYWEKITFTKYGRPLWKEKKMYETWECVAVLFKYGMMVSLEKTNFLSFFHHFCKWICKSANVRHQHKKCSSFQAWITWWLILRLIPLLEMVIKFRFLLFSPLVGRLKTAKVNSHVATK